MPETAEHSRENGLVEERHSPKPEEVRRQLRVILDSPVFHGSKRCKQFLEYVCEKTLAGAADTLKERTIAVEVFGRAPQSDLGEDTIVRVGAREVRKRLAQFYVTPEGLSAEVHIDLLPGSYAPEFHYASALKETAPQTSVVLVADEPKPRRYRMTIAVSALMAVAAVSIFAVAKVTGSNEEAFRKFWDPVFHSSDPLLLAVASPIVYHPSVRAIRKSEQNLPPAPVPVQRPISVPPNELDGSDLVPVFNQYVGFGDMVVATEVAAMLARKSQTVRVRMASGLQFADLRQSPSLLIGAITNRWTMELAQSWRFQFGYAPGLETAIVDTMDTAKVKRQWRVPASGDGTAAEDYMLICRLRNSVAGGVMYVAAGVKQFGTEAAGRLLTDPAQLSAVLGKLPRGWEDKNLQIVLHSKVIGNTPGRPDVVASYVW